MPHTRYRLVIDTNVVLRGLINPNSFSGRILLNCDQRRVVPLLSKLLLAEYRYILSDPEIVSHYPQLQARKVEVVLARLSYVGDVLHPIKPRFVYRRDPKDAKLIELAIAGSATHLLTYDGDLLDLPGGHDEASKRFRQRLPSLEVLSPPDFIDRHGL